MPEAVHAAVVADRRARLAARIEDLALAERPFLLEIGCGHGHFLNAFATAHPETLCIGIDILAERVGRAERKRERAGLQNLHFLRADADDFLAALPESARFADIFALFPDPWPKRRHHKNRLFQNDFLKQLARRSLPSARFALRTDHADYFRAIRETLHEASGWRLVDEPWPFEFSTIFQQRASHYHSLVARPLAP